MSVNLSYVKIAASAMLHYATHTSTHTVNLNDFQAKDIKERQEYFIQIMTKIQYV